MNVYETKRYEPDFSYEPGLPGMFETSKGGYVAHGDYATLFSELEGVKAERDALERQLSMSEAKCKGYFSDAAAALVRCDALAVENARCKFEVSRCHQTIDEMFKNRDKWIDKEWLAAIWSTSKRLMNETPATDAALAAIEARGVERFADFLGKQYQCEKANTAKGKAYKHVVFLACRFARELQEAK